MLANPRTWLLAVAVWAVALVLLSHQSKLQPPGPEFANRDKVMHATYFAIGGTFLFMMLRTKTPPMPLLKTCIIVILFCSLYGATDEIHQSFVPNRSGNDPGDWLADTLGGVIACGTGLLLQLRIRPKAPTS